MTTLLPNISPISKPSKTGLTDSSAKKLGLKSSEVSRILETQKSSPKLSIPDLFFGDEGAYEIARFLKDNHSFTSIELRGNNISASGFEAICDHLKDARSLKKISAEWNNIGSDNLGLIALHELLEDNKTIVSVDLRNNHIGAQCAGSISNIIRDASSLKTLDLRWNELGDEGASLILLALKDTSNKIQIDLTGNKVSQELLLEISSLTNERPTFSERPSVNKFEMSYQQTNRKDTYKSSNIGQTECTTHTPDRLSYNKENFQTENLPTQPSQQFKHERYPSVDRVLKPSMTVNATPLSKSNILRAQMPGSVTPVQVAAPRLDFEQSILSSNRIQTATPSVLRKSYAGIPQFEPIIKKQAPVGYNPEADLQEIQARYEQEARDVQEKYQSHMQAHLRMTKVINDLERYSEEEKGRANVAEARIQELVAELDTENKARQESEVNCSHLVAELQNRDMQIQEMSAQIQELSVHLDQSGRENADLRAMIESLKQENLAITQEFNAKLQDAETRFSQEFADLTAIYNGKIQDAEIQFNRELTDQTSQNHALKAQIDRLQEEFQHQIHHLHSESETRLREYEGKCSNATLATNELAEELKKQENYIQVLQAQHEEHLNQALMLVREEEYQKTQKIVADIERELRAVHGEYERVNARNKEITLDVQNYELQRRQQQTQYEGEISQLRAENDQLRNDLRIIASNFEKSKDEVSLKNAMISRMEGDVENLRSEITRTKDNSAEQIERLKRDFEFERKKSENTERESRRKILDLERELKESKEEVVRVTREHDRLGDMLKGNITKLISQTFNDYGKSGSTPSRSMNEL